METQLLSQPDGGDRLGDFLDRQFADHTWTGFRAAVAFVKQAGVRQIAAQLVEFSNRAAVKISVGVSFGGTSVEGLSALFEAVGNRGEIWVFHNGNGSTFHPKIYLFKNATHAAIAIGSGNLTSGGLYTNYEAGIGLKLDLANAREGETLRQIEAMLDQWCDPASGLARLLDDDLLDRLTEDGYLPPEVYSRETEEAGPGNDEEDVGEEAEAPIFATVAVQPAPQRRPVANVPGVVQAPVVAGANAGVGQAYYMTLQKTDVGVGQTTAGTSRRSPEIFIPLAARNAAPDFWEWPRSFVEDRTHPGKMDRQGVRMLIGTNVEPVNMMTWPDKSDFRLRSEAIRSGGQVGDILRIERTDGSGGYQYIVTIIPQHSRQYAAARAQCVNSTRNSAKEWGYV